jgi:cyclic pyranopterin phosphate synthase
MALDRFGRSIHYLRISLTDHCNLRCVYCMPEDMVFRPNAELLQDDEILLLVHLFAQLGFDKLRLTGGEPTVRAHIVELVREIARTPGVRSLSMTTNGVLLARLAEPLKKAGLQRVNVSLDTLDPEKFRRLTRWGTMEDVWQGIEAADRAGLTPIKINAVVVRGYNETDVIDLARLTLDHPWQVRFIEMMPFAGATELQQQQMVTAADMQTRIQAALGTLQTANDGQLDGKHASSACLELPEIRLPSRSLSAVLRRLHPRPADCRRAAAPVPAARRRSRPAHTPAQRRNARTAAPAHPGWNLGQTLGSRPRGRVDTT